MDRDSLYSMKVSQLRILCKEKRLLVSGNKEALIARILEDSGISVDSTASSDSKQERTKGDRDAAIDRLLARVEGGESNEKELPTPPPPSTPPPAHIINKSINSQNKSKHRKKGRISSIINIGMCWNWIRVGIWFTK